MYANLNKGILHYSIIRSDFKSLESAWEFFQLLSRRLATACINALFPLSRLIEKILKRSDIASGNVAFKLTL